MLNHAIRNLMIGQFLAKSVDEKIADLPFYTFDNLEMLASHETELSVLATIAKTRSEYHF